MGEDTYSSYSYMDQFGLPNPSVPMNTQGSIPGSNTSNSVLNLISAGLNSASNIFTARYAVPQLNPGEYIQNKTGVYYQGNPNSNSLLPGSLGAGMSTTTMLMLAGGVVVLIMMMNKH